jgi:hypothetical protein
VCLGPEAEPTVQHKTAGSLRAGTRFTRQPGTRGAEAAELEYTIGIPEEMAPGETMPERQTLRARLFDPAEAVTRVRRPAAAPPPEADLPSEADPSEAGPSTSTDASAPPPPPAGMDEE